MGSAGKARRWVRICVCFRGKEERSRDCTERNKGKELARTMNSKDELVWRNSMIQFVWNSVYKTRGMDTIRQICQKKLLELDKEIDKEVARLKLVEEINLVTEEASEVNDVCTPGLDLSHGRLDGVSNTRLKSHYEKRKVNPSKEALSSCKSKQVSLPVLLTSVDVNSVSRSETSRDQHHIYTHAPLPTHTQGMDYTNIPFRNVSQGAKAMTCSSQDSSTHVPSPSYDFSQPSSVLRTEIMEPTVNANCEIYPNIGQFMLQSEIREGNAESGLVPK